MKESGKHNASRENKPENEMMSNPTRSQLESAAVEAGVAKWGETERAGLVAQAKKRSTESLRVDWEIANGADAKNAVEKFGGRKSYNIARSAIEDGAS